MNNIKVPTHLLDNILPFQGKILHTDFLCNKENLIIRKERKEYNLDTRLYYFIRFPGYNNNTDKILNYLFLLLNLYKSKWIYYVYKNRIYIFQSTVCIEISTFNKDYVLYRLEKAISKRKVLNSLIV